MNEITETNGALSQLIPAARQTMTLPQYLNAIREGKIKPPAETAIGKLAELDFEQPLIVG